MKPDIHYKASPTMVSFHNDDSFVRGIMGPVGSGKSVACCWEVFRRIYAQAPCSDKIRKSRWVIIRNTYRELLDTTCKTFHDWFPQSLGDWSEQRMTQTIRLMHEDGSEVYAEVLFRALDRPDDIKKLLSLELTGAFVNEAREVPRQVIDMLQGRIGRYPSKRDGGPSWYGLIMDTNPPDDDSWWYQLFEEERPEGWVLYRQPGGRSAGAENIANLPDGYYERIAAGKSPEWVKVYVDGEYGTIMDGKPVYGGQWNDRMHVSPDEFYPISGVDVIIGMDFGLTPAAAVVQVTPGGQVRIIDEFVSDDMGIRQFAEGVLLPAINTKYANNNVRIIGDPAGGQRSQVDEQTAFGVMRELGLDVIPAPTNDQSARWEAVRYYLGRMTGGFPVFQLSPSCKQLRRGFNGAYRFRQLQVSGATRYSEKPEKNDASHVADALQYAMSYLKGAARKPKQQRRATVGASYGRY